jgi:hypothetical protein
VSREAREDLLWPLPDEIPTQVTVYDDWAIHGRKRALTDRWRTRTVHLLFPKIGVVFDNLFLAILMPNVRVLGLPPFVKKERKKEEIPKEKSTFRPRRLFFRRGVGLLNSHGGKSCALRNVTLRR